MDKPATGVKPKWDKYLYTVIICLNHTAFVSILKLLN